MAKISGKDPGDFVVIEEGQYLFRVKSARVNRPVEGKQGYLYLVESKVEGGELEGARHFESFFTHSSFGDGLDGARALLKFLNCCGALEDTEFDSDRFESEKFAAKFEKSVPDRLYIAEIKHKKDKEGKEWARSVKYMSPKESKGTASAPAAKKEDEDW